MVGWTLEELEEMRDKPSDNEMRELHHFYYMELLRQNKRVKDFNQIDVVTAEDFALWAVKNGKPVYHVERSKVSVALTFHDLAVHERNR